MASLIVSISRIDKIENLDNADKMQMATVKGWNCLVAKDQHNVGDLVVFIPPDAVLPDNLIEDLKLGYLKGNRIKTVKLRGYVSQGLVLSLEQVFPTATGFAKEGTDVAKVLGITKYEPPEPEYSLTTKRQTLYGLLQEYRAGELSLKRYLKKSFYLIIDSLKPKRKLNPLFDKYTDIENVKHYNSVFKENEQVIMTEKIHGTNFRAGCLPRYATGNPIRRLYQFISMALGKKYEFVYGSRTVQKTISNRNTGFYDGDCYGRISEKYNLKNIIPQDYIIYGEIYGTNPAGKKAIQKHYDYGKTDDVEVAFFDVKYRGRYLDFDEAQKFFQKFNLPTVPVLYRGPFNLNALKYATEGLSILYPKVVREGTVIRPEKETVDFCGRKVLKSINPDYDLIKDGTQWH